MTRVMLTGAAGFVGSHVLSHLLAHTDWEIVCPVTFRHKGNPKRITEDKHYLAHKDRVEIVTCDLTGVIPDLGDFDYILNLASESHVDRSITDPVPFVENNVALVLQVLEYARKHPPRVFVQFSTDEIYGPAPDKTAHVEWDPIVPSNPYSASKAAQEAIAVSYWRTYGVPVVIVNAMNFIGERQDSEKFVPMVMKQVLSGKEVAIHGNTSNIGSRFYLHARNVADALKYLLDYHSQGTNDLIKYPHVSRPYRYNVVGNREVDNLEMAKMVAEYVGKPLKYKLVDFHSARPGHDSRYALDGSSLAELGWEAPVPLDESLKNTVEWTLKHPDWLK